jgi:hypothetical protein
MLKKEQVLTMWENLKKPISGTIIDVITDKERVRFVCDGLLQRWYQKRHVNHRHQISEVSVNYIKEYLQSLTVSPDAPLFSTADDDLQEIYALLSSKHIRNKKIVISVDKGKIEYGISEIMPYRLQDLVLEFTSSKGYIEYTSHIDGMDTVKRLKTLSAVEDLIKDEEAKKLINKAMKMGFAFSITEGFSPIETDRKRLQKERALILKNIESIYAPTLPSKKRRKSIHR